MVRPPRVKADTGTTTIASLIHEPQEPRVLGCGRHVLQRLQERGESLAEAVGGVP